MMRVGLILLALVLGACGTGVPSIDTPRNPPTLPAPDWVTGDVPITLANSAAIRYLGRLDPPDTLGTWFDFALSPDATALAALNVEQLVSWDLLTGRTLFYTGRGDITRVFYSPDKTELYGVTDAGLTGVFDALTGAQTTGFNGHPAFSGAADFYADLGWLALGGTDGTIKVWDTFERRSLVTLTASTDQIVALTFSWDGTRLASAAQDGTIRVWDWQTRQEITSTQITASSITALTFAPDGTRLAIGTNTNARLWRLESPDNLSTIDSSAAETLRFNGDGRYLLIGGRSSGLSLWDGERAILIGTLPDTAGDGISAAFAPDEALLVTATLNGGVYLWNLTEVSERTLNQAALDIGTRQIYRVHWASDGRLILFFDAVGAVYLWGIQEED